MDTVAVSARSKPLWILLLLLAPLGLRAQTAPLVPPAAQTHRTAAAPKTAVRSGPGMQRTATDPANAAPASPAASPKQLWTQIENDQKTIWRFPLGAATGRHWQATLPMSLGTAALVELDPHDSPYFRRRTRFEEFNEKLSGGNTAAAELLLPLALYTVGWRRHDDSTQQTAILAGRALIDTQIVAEVMKNIDRRLRPRQIPANGDFAHTWFKQPGAHLISDGSFPSGHTISAFALADVLAERYSTHRWVPWLAYGAAGLIAASRVTTQAHFPSDVVAGGVLGFAIAHFVVLKR